MRIFIIDDEKILSQSIKKSLSQLWYDVVCFSSFDDLLSIEWNSFCDIYIIDIWLPKQDWFHIIQHIRNVLNYTTPIIVLSWFHSINYKVDALDLWADDYMTKPFSLDELSARIRSIVRRWWELHPLTELKYNKFIFDVSARTLTYWESFININKKEMQIVEFFFRNIWTMIHKDFLIKEIWWIKIPNEKNENKLRVTLHNIRKKLWDFFYLETKVGEWYILLESR